jgi:hypothetical protein
LTSSTYAGSISQPKPLPLLYTPSSFSPLPGKFSNNGFNSHQRNSPEPRPVGEWREKKLAIDPSTEAGVAAKRQKRQKKNNGGQTLTRTEINARNQAMAIQRRDRAIETGQESWPKNTKKTYQKAQGVVL